MSFFVLGVDQGHTGTRAAVARADGSLLGVGRAGGAGHAQDGLPAALAAIGEAAGAALAQAGCQMGEAAVLVGGLTDADWPDEIVALTEALAALRLAERVIVKNDCLIALRAGTAAPYGAVLIAGSGVNCAVRSPSGAEWIYGYYVENEIQGGSALGRMALRAVYRSATLRAPPTCLTQALLDACGLASVDALLRADVEHRLPQPERHLAPAVFECAAQGDEAASGLLRQMGHDLAELVTAGLRRLGMSDMPVEVVLSGGLFRGRSPLLADTIRAGLAAEAPQARLVPARYEPVVGAALLALEAAGLALTPEMNARLDAGAQALGLVREVA